MYILVKSISFPGKPLEEYRGGIYKADFVPMFTQLMLMFFCVNVNTPKVAGSVPAVEAISGAAAIFVFLLFDVF